MKINVCLSEQNDKFCADFRENNGSSTVGFGEAYTLQPATDYNNLTNKPKINTITLEGELTAEDLGLGRVYYDTTEHWNAQRSLITERGAVYVYSDYEYIVDENDNRTPIAGVKIGDGSSYLIDMPFASGATSSIVLNHLADNVIHITPQEREFWNNKVSSFIRSDDMENLVLSKIAYVIDGDVMPV